MEEAIFITKLGNLKYVTEKYSRLYFGNEFCQWLIPTKETTEQVLEFALQKGIDFTLVTPYVTDEGLEKLRPLFNSFIKKFSHGEVVVNDWGVLRMINREYEELQPLLGRLLTKQKRGPRILNMMGRVPETMVEHFRRSNVDLPILQEFLRGERIERVELDNLLQGIGRKPNLKGSLYHPFAYITTTRMCLTNSCDHRTKPLRAIFPCHKECQKYTFKLKHKNMPVEILLKGNTQFFKNKRLPRNLEAMGIDRLVFQPEIPM